jgi:RHS repeat-associated protein
LLKELPCLQLTKGMKSIRVVWALMAFVDAAGITAAQTNPALLQVNRTLPKVQPPKTGWQFSETPTTQEIFRAHVFEEPLVPIGDEPAQAENDALVAALRSYAKRSGPDDFSSLTGFLEQHPRSAWCAGLLTDLGLEYYNTAHYSLALEAWARAWSHAKYATDAKGKAIADRAVGELSFMYARLGRMKELEVLLKSVEGRGFTGPASGKITGAREGLWSMQNQPGVSFRCGPLALRCIQVSLDSKSPLSSEILNSASTQKGFSLMQVAELSKKVGLSYHMAFRESDGAFVVPSVIHWKVGHYAALVRKEGNLYLLQDPTFGNETWATWEALEAETSGYFLIPPGPLPKGWRSVDEKEGDTVWGKGQTSGNDDRNIGRNDLSTSGGVCRGMAVPSVHLMAVNLSLNDEPLGYTPPVGPAVRLRMCYNHRDSFQPGIFNYSCFAHNWTCDWISFIRDNPTNALANVKLYAPGGGEREFTGFDTNKQTFAAQQYDETILKRAGPANYELNYGDGSKLVFAQPDGSVATSRKVFLSRIVDPAGNAVTLTYDADLRLVALTDAIGQVTTLSYASDNPVADDTFYYITKVTDPFGRIATFGYETVAGGLHPFIRLVRTTDVIGLNSTFAYKDDIIYDSQGNPIGLVFTTFIKALTTPYGTSRFDAQDSGNKRVIETTYPDGSRERVEYNQTNNIPLSDPVADVPLGMATHNNFLRYRNTYYWSRTACALGYGDISKARLYHWLHTESLSTTAGALESVKAPLEGRVWYDYPGQSDSIVIAPNALPAHLGRVQDDGSTQLFSFGYNSHGHLTNSVDPLGRTLSFIYSPNETDLLEVRQTRAANNESLMKMTYNSQHNPLTMTDASGQTTMFTYNSRGQVLTRINPKNETTRYTYDINGYLVAIDGRLAGTNDNTTFTHDFFGRVRTMTDVSAYTLTFDYDDMDRVTRITHPDTTFSEFTYERLDRIAFRDRAGRQTSFEYDRMRQVTQITDPLLRTTLFEWCSCGDLKSLTDPMGRRTSWTKDVQGRVISKQFGDGSQINYFYESTTSRRRKIVDEKQQETIFVYNRDNSPKSVAYGNTTVPTPGVSFTYDPNYERIVSMTDGEGTTTYSYNPITTVPTLGAGKLATVDGPLPNDTITYGYDELGRRVSTALNGVAMLDIYDAAGRVITKTNALGLFNYAYDGSSRRVLSETSPNGLTTAASYGDNLHDRRLQQITHTFGPAPISQFIYDRDIPKGRITSWSQQAAAQPPSVFGFGYDAANQLLSAAITNSGLLVDVFAYTYDLAGNRLTEQVGGSNYTATFNALNQISTTTTASGALHTNEWDAVNRLTAVNAGNQRTEFAYDGLSRMVGIRKLVNGSEVSYRRFVWCGEQICEERDAAGANVSKRFYAQGVKLETGASAGAYFYSCDHLGSIRELADSGGNVRARYGYDPFGRRTKHNGDLDTDFGFAGMFFSSEASLALTHFRMYDPGLGRWLSRDPLRGAEMTQGPNLYAYVGNEPISRTDPLGLCTGSSICACFRSLQAAAVCAEAGLISIQQAADRGIQVVQNAGARCAQFMSTIPQRVTALEIRYQSVATNLRNEYEQWLEIRPTLHPILTENTALWTEDMITLDREFHDIAIDLEVELGISFEEAWALLVERLGFNPDVW